MGFDGIEYRVFYKVLITAPARLLKYKEFRRFGWLWNAHANASISLIRLMHALGDVICSEEDEQWKFLICFLDFVFFYVYKQVKH